MIKTWIKHHIYEYCIDIIYRQIFNNFIFPKYLYRLPYNEYIMVKKTISEQVKQLKLTQNKAIKDIQDHGYNIEDNEALKTLENIIKTVQETNYRI